MRWNSRWNQSLARHTRHLVLATSCALGALAATGVVSTAQAQTLKWAAQNDILTMDPHSQNHATTLALLMHAYEGLTRYDRSFKVEPALATEWKQISPTHWRFSLRKNVKFHDGSPLTADDVVFSFGRIKHPNSTMQIYVAGVKDVKKVDDHTIDFLLDGPDPVLLRKLIDFRIMSKAWAEKNNTAKVGDFKSKEETFANRNVNGTGSYVIKSWEPDVKVTMTANPNWWGQRDGNIKEVQYIPIKADATRIAALMSGDVDIVTDLPTPDVARLKQNPSLKVVEGHEVRTIYIALDHHNDELQYSDVKGKNPFKDVRVRRALNMAVDAEAIKNRIMRGLSIPAGIMVAPGVNGWTQELDKRYPVDLDGAKKLLAEAGYPNGFELTLDCPNNRYVNDEEICQAVVGMWAKIGIKAKLNAMPFATYIPKILKHDSSAYMLGWGVATFDANYTLQSLVRTKTTGANGNYNLGRISNPAIDKLIDGAAVETDVAKRDQMLRDALKMTADEAHLVPLHHQLRPWAMKKNVTTLHRADDRPETRFARID